VACRTAVVPAEAVRPEARPEARPELRAEARPSNGCVDIKTSESKLRERKEKEIKCKRLERESIVAMSSGAGCGEGSKIFAQISAQISGENFGRTVGANCVSKQEASMQTFPLCGAYGCLTNEVGHAKLHY
jgi:hypothetical protein